MSSGEGVRIFFPFLVFAWYRVTLLPFTLLRKEYYLADFLWGWGGYGGEAEGYPPILLSFFERMISRSL